MSRSFWVLLHRWAGLAMAGFLVVVGLTGSVLAFREDLDCWLNPGLLTVAIREAPTRDPLELLEKAEAYEPRTRAPFALLNVEPGRSLAVQVEPRNDPATGKAFEVPFTQMYLDPYSGDVLGVRKLGEASLATQDLIPFLYRLHMSLALPASTGMLGTYVLGITALVWTIDCFVSFYLTLPIRRREREKGAPPTKSWWARWRPAWLIKLNGGAYRINFDIHRAFGLWTWAMLFVFAWSSVAFNLNEVYIPTMRTLFGGLQFPEETAGLATPLETPRLNWREAREAGHALIHEQARAHGFVVGREEVLWLDRAHGVYTFSAAGPLDASLANTGVSVTFDADTGALRDTKWPGSTPVFAGDTITAWLIRLHMAKVFGLPMKIFVCVMGFVITALSVTGVVIWLKKRSARKFQARRETQRHSAAQKAAAE
jgi:uncharacterized iron-regulated membrane protein